MHKVLPLVAHHRFRLLLLMLLAIQAACLVDRIERGEERSATLIGVSLVGVLLVAPFVLVKFPTHERLMGAMQAVIPSVVVSVLACIPPRSRRLGALLLVAVVIEIWSVTYIWSPPLRQRLMYPSTPLIAELKRLKSSEREPFRVAGWGATFFPNNAAIFGLQDIRVHDPMGYAKYMSYLRLAAGYGAWDYFAQWLNVDTPLLDYLNVRYVLVDDPKLVLDAQRYQLVYEGRDGRIFRNLHWLPRFFPVRNVVPEFRDELFWQRMKEHRDFANTAILDRLQAETPQMRDDFFQPRRADAPAATSKILRATNADYRIAVQAPRWSLMVSSIPWWPGWKVERNGQRIDPIRVNGVFLGFAVPPGQSDVRVWYAPWSYWAGVWIAIATLFLLAIGYRRLDRSRTPQATSNR
jgi:hypothetical protein